MARKQPTFKPYNQEQIMLLPPSLEELVPKSHLVRIVNEVINKVNLEPLNASYKTIGASSYHPKMLLKVLVYGYASNVYSSRKLEASCKESIYFMWVSGMSYRARTPAAKLFLKCKYVIFTSYISKCVI